MFMLQQVIFDAAASKLRCHYMRFVGFSFVSMLHLDFCILSWWLFFYLPSHLSRSGVSSRRWGLCFSHVAMSGMFEI